jgi:hypothetical protein
MKRFILSLMILVGALLCMGMGGVGGEPEGTIPETDVRIQAMVIDNSAVETTLNQFSMDGKTHLTALRGQGRLTIPFQHIATIEFGELSGDMQTVQVKLKSGNTMELSVRHRSYFYGSTGFGAFKIKARDIAKITFP